jgi:dCMP deaminase
MQNEDEAYMIMAKASATNSTCRSRHIGAILVTMGFKDILYGWNGPPTDVQACIKCPRREVGAKSGERMDLCPAVHAERRPLLMAAKNGCPTEGSTLYAWCGLPCKDCMVELIQAGVKRIVCLDDDKFNRKTPTSYNFELSAKLAKEAGIEVTMMKEKDFA